MIDCDKGTVEDRRGILIRASGGRPTHVNWRKSAINNTNDGLRNGMLSWQRRMGSRRAGAVEMTDQFARVVADGETVG